MGLESHQGQGACLHLFYSQKRTPPFPKSPFGLVSEKPRCSCSLPPSPVTVETIQTQQKQVTESPAPLTLVRSPEPGLPAPLPGQKTVWMCFQALHRATGPQSRMFLLLFICYQQPTLFYTQEKTKYIWKRYNV